jgi:deoxyribodipyrimidine photo-lyase
LDYRCGERYFTETLVDWDLNNNTSQAEMNDPNGDYIRKWLPELEDVRKTRGSLFLITG